MAPPTSAPRYDMGRNPPYQINYRAKRAGKHISASKRRVTFQFGFSSASAIADGLEGIECRGEEHEVVLVWSHVTGKRQLFMDGREIHMSKAARGNTRFDYSWGIQGGHVMKITANGTPPLRKERMVHRQFDLELDGMSFFEFARIYELGGNGGRGSGRAERPQMNVGYSYRGAGYDSRDDGGEEEYVDEAPPVASIDLFDSASSQQPSEPQVSPVTQFSNQFGSVPSLVGSSTSMSSAASYTDEFTPVEQIAASTKTAYDNISNDILAIYASAPPAPVESTPSISRALVPMSEEGMDPIAKTMKGIVNLDDITSKPLLPIKPNEEKKTVPSWALAGRAPTLVESAAHRQGSQREIMRTQPAMQQVPLQGEYQQPQYQQQVQYQQQGQYQQQQYQAYQQAASFNSYQYGAQAQGYSPAY